MAEVPPWVVSYVSVGQFRTHRELRVVDSGRSHEGFAFHLEEPDEAGRMGRSLVTT